MKRVAIFCGSKKGAKEEYQLAAKLLVEKLVKKGLGIVYGGGAVGLMGVVADTAIETRGEVIGVIPDKLYEMEVAHTNLTMLHRVANMHQRKAKMAELADAFITLPGGVGTLEEITEAMTWSQLGYHQKPCAFLNTAGYFDHFISFFEHMQEEGFLYAPLHEQAIVESDVDKLVERLE